ncbi:MAG: HAD-IC family P-type ATPase [Nitrospinae bacterium]|nr:HAD-IC family P-type ATPase [Nitrospinota bacterium]
MKISQLLIPDLIISNLRAQDHINALKKMAGILGEDWKGDESIHSLMEHESMDGMLLGTGSAIFHTLSEDVKDIKIVLAISKKGVPHPKRRKEFIHIFFLLISPIKDSGTHLQLLSRIEGLLLNRVIRHALSMSQNKEEILKILKREEEMGREIYIPLSKEDIFSTLGTKEEGLSEEEALHRLKIIGPNLIKRIEKRGFLKDLYSNLTNLFALLLWIGGVLSFIAGMPELGWAIFLVIMINASFSFWQEYKAERAIEALQRLLPKKVHVLRDGQEKEVPAHQLVPGDIIIVREGDSISADGRLIKAEAMRVDNSALTGESKPVYKIAEPLEDGKRFLWTELPNLIFAGTGIISGSGRVVVTSTGMDTEIGRVAYLTQTLKEEMSPLQKEMVNVTRTVTVIAIALGFVFFILGYSLAGLTLTNSFIFAIGIIVANVPEGLLPTVTLSLAMGVQRMANRGAIVKRLSAVETLGCTTVICTDKTGTLTTNQMCVVRIWINEKMIHVTGSGYTPEGDFLYKDKVLERDELRREGVEDLLIAGSLCNNANILTPNRERKYWSVSGDPTEGALLVTLQKAGLDIEKIKEEYTRIQELPFERIRRRMTTIHKGRDGKIKAYIKGAPKETLSLCNYVYKNGGIINLDDREREKILKENDLMASRGLRILAITYREIEWMDAYTVEDTERELIFLGLVAMVDPPKYGVKEAVEQCHMAGIRIVMITGDYSLTAQAVGEAIGINGTEIKILTGDEITQLSHRSLGGLLMHERDLIFARVTPKDKLRIVEALQDNGEIVAVTGDGVNDAPALKKADIGIAMGMRGSDVAKESAAIVLTDDNFITIVDAIREGRVIYANIKKFVTYIFASNIPEIVPFIAFVLFKIPLPLTVMQILAVDLGTDLVPALGLGVEPPEEGIMKKLPRARDKRLLDINLMARAYLFLGPIEAVICLSGFFFAYWLRGWHAGMEMPAGGLIYITATTISLAGIVTSQIWNVFACRTEIDSVFKAGLSKNRFVLFGIMIEILLILLFIYIPFLQKVFGLAPLGVWDWLFLLILSPVVLLAEEGRKLFLRLLRRHPQFLD